MNNILPSLIRTFVPIVVGALISYLLTLGIEIDGKAQDGLVMFLTVFLQGAYYLVARLLERKSPQIGAILLGSSKQPVYKETN